MLHHAITSFTVLLCWSVLFSNCFALHLLDSLTPNSTEINLRIDGTFGRQRLPSELGSFDQLSSVKIVCEEQGCITGFIPTEIGRLKNLHTFEVLNSNMFGNIPSEVAQLGNLQHFSVPGARLSGMLPKDFGPNLVTLNVARNSFTGPLPEFSSKSLKTVQVQWNDLSGNIPQFTTLQNRPDSDQPVIIFFPGNDRLRGTWSDAKFPLYMCKDPMCHHKDGVYFNSLPAGIEGNACKEDTGCFQSFPNSTLTLEALRSCRGGTCCEKNTNSFCQSCGVNGTCTEFGINGSISFLSVALAVGVPYLVFLVLDVLLVWIASYVPIHDSDTPSSLLSFCNTVSDLKFIWLIFIRLPLLAAYIHIMQESIKTCHLAEQDKVYCLPGMCQCDQLVAFNQIIGGTLIILIPHFVYTLLTSPLYFLNQNFFDAIDDAERDRKGGAEKLRIELETYPNYYRMQGRLGGAKGTIMTFLVRNPLVMVFVVITNSNSWAERLLLSVAKAKVLFKSSANDYHAAIRLPLKFVVFSVYVATVLVLLVYRLLTDAFIQMVVGDSMSVKTSPVAWFPYWQCIYSPYWCGNTAVQHIANYGSFDCLKVAIEAGLPRSVNEEVYLAVHQLQMPKQVIKLLIKDQPEFDMNWRPNSWWYTLSSKSTMEVAKARWSDDLVAVLEGTDENDDTEVDEFASLIGGEVKSTDDKVEGSEGNELSTI